MLTHVENEESHTVLFHDYKDDLISLSIFKIMRIHVSESTFVRAFQHLHAHVH